jgi:hypothetical protein
MSNKIQLERDCAATASIRYRCRIIFSGYLFRTPKLFLFSSPDKVEKFHVFLRIPH